MVIMKADEDGEAREQLHRTTLRRELALVSNPPTILFVMLNPSTADATQDDNTIRRCKSFAIREGFSRLEVCNLFTRRATDPKELDRLDWEDLNVPDHQALLVSHRNRASVIVCAWGAINRKFDEHARWVAGLMSDGERMLYCLGRTQSGHPRHPLYLRLDSPLQEYGVFRRKHQ